MAESTTNSSTPTTNTKPNKSLMSFLLFHLKLWFIPILLAIVVVLFHVDPYDPAPSPLHELTQQKAAVIAPRTNNRMLKKAELVGSGRLIGPEDMAYEPKSGIIYTGCLDGWIKRVKVGESIENSVVEDWVNTGGRPLGIATTSSGDELIVADAHKGLLKISKNKEIELLTDEVEGKKFKCTDGVDIAKDGTIYFTDASYKYGVEDYLYDVLEGRPYGRLLSFNSSTKETKVLLQDLYYPNGVAISPDQNSLVFCETPLMRCRTYWIQGSRKGEVDTFIDNLPGFPDNIHSDGQNYWIAISSVLMPYLDQAMKNRLVRKAILMLDRYVSVHHVQRNGGIMGVDLEGKPTLHVYDGAMSLITSGIKIKDHLYIGSLHYAHIIRFNLSYT